MVLSLQPLFCEIPRSNIHDSKMIRIALRLSIQLFVILGPADPVVPAENAPSSLAPTIANTAKPSPAPEGMVWIPGGEFSMGANGQCGGASVAYLRKPVNDCELIETIFAATAHSPARFLTIHEDDAQNLIAIASGLAT